MVSEVRAVVMVIAVSTVHSPAVSTSVGNIHRWSGEVVERASRISCVDAEVPAPSVPVERTEEVRSSSESVPLPVEQDVAKVEIASCPVVAIDIIHAGHAHQVVEVNLVCGVILSVREIELVSHFVCQEQRLSASLFVTHCVGRSRKGHQCHYCHQYLFHNRIFFKLLF